jgi:hypothetical protein
MKKKKLFETVKFIAILAVGASVILSLFLPFMLSSAHK